MERSGSEEGAVGCRGAAERRSATTAAATVLALTAYAVCFYRDLLFGDRIYVFRDIYTILLATEHTVRELANFEWPPLWNPFVVLGKPLVAEPLAAIYYPVSWLQRLLHEPLGYNASVAFHHVVAGWGAYTFLRHRAIDPAAAFFGALLFAFGGVFVSYDNMINAVQSATWLPWTMLAFDRWCDRPHFGALAALALCLAMTLLGAMPEVFLMENALFPLFLLERRASGKEPGWGRALLAVAAANGLALGLGGGHLLPLAEYLALSSRSQGLNAEGVLRLSLPPAGVLAFLVPRRYQDAAGLFDPTAGLWEGTLRQAPWALSLYLGPILVLAVAAGGRRWRFWATAGVLFTLLAMGRYLPGISGLFERFPILRVGRYPEKLLLVPHAILAAAAAVGLHRLRGDASLARRVVAVAVAASAVAAVAHVWVAGSADAARQLLAGDLAVLAPLFLAPGLLAWLASYSRALATGGLIALAAIDLFRVNSGILPTVAWSEATAVPPALAAMQRSGDPLRIYSNGIGLPPVPAFPESYLQERNLMLMEVANYHLVGNLNAPGSINLRDHELLEATLENAPHERVARLFAALNTPYLTSPIPLQRPGLEVVRTPRDPTDAYVLRVADPAPRAFVPRRLYRAADEGDAVRFFQSGGDDPVAVVAVDAGVVGDGIPAEMRGVVHLDRYLGSRVEMTATMETPGLVVLSDTFYPGWEARVNGRSAPIVRANYFCRGVFVGAGTQRIELEYRPWSHRAGLIATGLAAVILLGGVVREVRTDRPKA